jgi:hypothetical protein
MHFAAQCDSYLVSLGRPPVQRAGLGSYTL